MGHGAAGCILEEAQAVSAPQAQRQAIWRPRRTGQGLPCVPGPQPIPCITATCSNQVDVHIVCRLCVQAASFKEHLPSTLLGTEQ